MGRVSRDWVRKTYTVSESVEKAIAVRAVELGVDPGTVVDILVWDALVKPDEARHKAGRFSVDELERMFAEEALAHLDEEGVEELADYLNLLNDKDDPDDVERNLRRVWKLVKRWRKTRLIEKEHQVAVMAALNNRGYAPSLITHGHVDLDWFEAD